MRFLAALVNTHPRWSTHIRYKSTRRNDFSTLRGWESRFGADLNFLLMAGTHGLYIRHDEGFWKTFKHLEKRLCTELFTFSFPWSN